MTNCELIISPTIRPDGSKHPNSFDAVLNGVLICASDTPFYSACRKMLKSGLAQSGDIVTMRHSGAAEFSMRSTVGYAAKWSINETGSRPRRVKWLDLSLRKIAGAFSASGGGVVAGTNPNAQAG